MKKLAPMLLMLLLVSTLSYWIGVRRTQAKQMFSLGNDGAFHTLTALQVIRYPGAAHLETVLDYDLDAYSDLLAKAILASPRLAKQKHYVLLKHIREFRASEGRMSNRPQGLDGGAIDRRIDDALRVLEDRGFSNMPLHATADPSAVSRP